jgi:hypothetical protein
MGARSRQLTPGRPLMASVTVTTSVSDVRFKFICHADPRGVELTTWYCFHCYARTSRPTGLCVSCGGSIESPRALTYDEQLIWALDHPLPDTAITAARALGERRTAAAVGPLRRTLAHPSDPIWPRRHYAPSWRSTVSTRRGRFCASWRPMDRCCYAVPPARSSAPVVRRPRPDLIGTCPRRSRSPYCGDVLG